MLGKDEYIDLYDESFSFEISEDDLFNFILNEKRDGKHLDEIFIGHYCGKKAIEFLMRVEMMKSYRSTKKNSTVYIQQFIIDLSVGKFDGKKLKDVITNLKKINDDGTEEKLSLAESIQLSEHVKSHKKNLTHHGYTFPHWDRSCDFGLKNEEDIELCRSIAKNESYKLFTRKDYIDRLTEDGKREIANIDSFISKIVSFF
jgi:hypothetical protein